MYVRRSVKGISRRFLICNLESRVARVAIAVLFASFLGGAGARASCPSFASATNLTAGTNPYGVAIADFNHDGRSDLAVVNSADSTVSVFLRGPLGTFDTPNTYSTGFNTSPDAILVADFNGDGMLDIATANVSSSDVGILLGIGGGNFNPVSNYTVGSANSPRNLAVADFNGDGKPDLAVINSNTNHLVILIGNGNGSFQSPVVTDVGTGTSPYGVAVGDFNRDGKADVAVSAAGTGAAIVLIGNGNGTFQTPVSYSGTGAAYDVTVADFNRDGVQDLAVASANNSVEVFLGNTGGTFQPPVTTMSGGSAGTTFYLKAADFNGDGIPDVVMTNAAAGTVTVLIGSGTGSFTVSASPAVATQGPNPQVQRIDVGDIDGDGRPDIAVSNYSSGNASILLNSSICFDSCGTLAIGNNFGAHSAPAALAIADFNRDGIPDVVVANSGSGDVSILLGSAGGSFGTATNVYAGSAPSSVAVGDFDHDGKLDLAVANGGNVAVLPGNGSGSFGSAVTLGAGTTPTAIVAGDFDRDGSLDLAVANAGSNDVTILRWNGNAFQGAGTYGVGSNPVAIAAADFNADGVLDLAVVDKDSAAVSILIGNSNGSFGTASSYSVGSSPVAIAMGDFDRNGTLDLAVANSASTSVSILRGNGNATFWSGSTINLGNAPSAIATGDFDRDGKVDLVIAVGTSNAALFIGNGDATFQSGAAYGTASGPVALAVADVDRDGKPDVVSANQGADNITVLRDACVYTSDLTVTKTHNGNFTQGQTGATYTITVRNIGNGPTSGTVYVTDQLPPGLSATLIDGGPNWNCTTGSLSCWRSDALAARSSYDAITLVVTVDSNASPTVTNAVSVSGGGETNTGNDSAADPTTIVQVADLVPLKSHTGNFLQGQSGATYTLRMQNIGPGPSSGTVSITDNPPTGLTITAMNGGTAWNCTLATRTCTRSDVLAAGGTYAEAVTVTVNVAGNALSNVTNIATVSGGGEIVTSNDSVSDPTIIAQPSDLTVAVAHTGNFMRGQMFRTYTITVGNSGPAATNGTTTVVDTLPAGLTATSIGGSGWSCKPASLTCTSIAVILTGASYPPIKLTVNVASNAPATVTNSATVSGVSEVNTANDTASDPTTIVAAAPACGMFAAGDVYSGYTSPQRIAPGDFDGDGFTDLAVADVGIGVRIFLGHGDGTFAAPKTFTAGGSSLAAGDFNGDGRLDLAVAQFPSSVSVFLGNGDGTFGTATTYSAGADYVAVGDVNGDGILDIVALNGSSSVVVVLRGTGNGAFVAGGSFTTGTNPASVTVADLDGDGKLDLVVPFQVSNSTVGYVSVLLGNGNGTFATKVDYGLRAFYSRPQQAVVGDFNGDGSVDLAFANFNYSTVTVLLGNGNGTFGYAANYSGPAFAQSIAVADFDQDGKLDLVLASFFGNKVAVMLGLGDGSFATEVDYATGDSTYPYGVAVGDFTGDGRPSIAFTESNAGKVGILVNGCPDLAMSKTHTGNFSPGQIGATYSLTVSNAGIVATSGTVTVVDTLPTGLTATAINGTNWNCTLGTLTCTRSDSLAAGATYPEAITVTVNVASNASPSVTNSATVSGGSEVNTANDAASDPTIVMPPDLVVAKAHVGNFTQGQLGSYTITVTNSGGASIGTVTVTDILPAGLYANSMSGTGWTCTLSSLTCTRSDVLAYASSYPSITVSARAASNAPSSVTNSATVSGGAEINASNDSASDPTTINAGGLVAPTNLRATLASLSQVTVTWDAVPNAVTYKLYRKTAGGGYGIIATQSATTFPNTGLQQDTTYAYQVEALDASSNVSPRSNADLATTIIFIDDPVAAGSTTVKAAHLAQLRTAIDAVLAAAGSSIPTYTDAASSSVVIQAVHINELRANLNNGRSQLGLSQLVFTDPTLSVGMPVRAAHVQELREGVK